MLYSISACFVTLFAILALYPVAHRVGLVDQPGGRKTHTHHTPLIGGIGMFLGLLTLELVSPDAFHDFFPLIATAGLLLLVGLVDDFREIPANLRLGVHIAAALLMVYWGGNRLTSMGDLLFVGPIVLGVLAVPVTIFAVAAAINPINMADGVDGLCGGLVLITLGFMAVLANDAKLLHAQQLLVVMACCVAGFLVLNFRFPGRQRALIFMGDAGSTVLGFIVAWMVIYLAENGACSPVTVLWLIALPLLDTASVMVIRKLEGKSMFTPGRDHLHHHLLDAGLGVRKSVMVMYVLSAVFGMAGVAGERSGLPEGVLFLGFMAMLVAHVAIMVKVQRSKARRAAPVATSTEAIAQ
jgi:UDP-GlcNAc:undecaprenyl-phosphate GlcNAc-1-phosphate transferase